MMKKILLGLLLAGVTAGCQSPMERAGYSGPINRAPCNEEGATEVWESSQYGAVPLICQSVTEQIGHSTYDNLHPRYATSLKWVIDEQRIEALGTTVRDYLGLTDVLGPPPTTTTSTTTTAPSDTGCRYDYRTGQQAFEDCLVRYAHSK
ncbi:MAG: hypothetical protein AB1679_14975 [Actinomycetota bacterium]|jgi:hypothetical protein